MTWAEHLEAMRNTPAFINEANPLRFSAPESEGLYLVGSTNFNPFTHEEIYLVKVGKSYNLQRRMKDYLTTNPGMFHIDFCTIPRSMVGKSEWQCHAILYAVCKGKVEKSEEWVRVSREVYLEICEKGFKYFSEKM